MCAKGGGGVRDKCVSMWNGMPFFRHTAFKYPLPPPTSYCNPASMCTPGEGKCVGLLRKMRLKEREMSL